MSARAVRVGRNRDGDWDIELPDQDGRASCETLEEAERVAHICAAYQQPCELVVCDAYHRVLRRELIDAGTDQASQAPQSRIGDVLAILDAPPPPPPPSIAPGDRRPQSQQASET